MPQNISTADRIIEICNTPGVSIFLDGSDEHDSAKIGAYYTYDQHDKILTIFLANLRPNTWEKLKPFLKDKWIELGIVLFEAQEKALESYLEYKEENPDAFVLEFFKDKIPEQDLDILKMALYLRNEKEKGNVIDEYKQEIWNKYGERGVYISNLCNSGYFEEEFIQEYKDRGKAEFDKYYDLVINKELAAIFVHHKLKPPLFRDKFENTLINARRYYIPSFRIHGFGSWNVDLIKTFFESYKDDPEGLSNEFDLRTVEYSKYPPSLIYEIILKDIRKV